MCAKLRPQREAMEQAQSSRVEYVPVRAEEAYESEDYESFLGRLYRAVGIEPTDELVTDGSSPVSVDDLPRELTALAAVTAAAGAGEGRGSAR